MPHSDSRSGSDRGRPPFGNNRGGGRPAFGGNNSGRGGPPRGGRPMGRPGGGSFGRPDLRSAPKTPKPPKADVVFKDDWICVLNKPAGLPIRGESHETLRESAWELGFVRKLKMRPAHEIDTLASGGVLLVKTRGEVDSPREMTRPETNYLVVVEGEYDEDVVKSGSSINGPVEGSKSSGANPVTHFRVLETGAGLSLLQVRARPDLQGQIRQHLAQSGHPILGDTDFGSTRDDLKRLAMHAFEIRYEDPETEKIARVRVPAPHSFWSVMGAEPAMGMSAEAEEIESNPDQEGWDKVAGWYDNLLSVRGSDHHEDLILPGVTRLVNLQPNERLLDVACGQGLVARHLIAQQPGATAVGIDASPELIERASGQSPESISYVVGDARSLGDSELGDQEYDAAVCVLALMNIDHLDDVFAGVSSRLKVGGRFVAVILHPAFRNPGATAWGWITDERTRQPVQFRRVDQYMSERTQEIVMNPGQVSSGATAIKTHTHHRPMSSYVTSMGKNGLLVDTIEEWSSKRESEPGPRAKAENTAREEIPMFMAIRAIRSA